MRYVKVDLIRNPWLGYSLDLDEYLSVLPHIQAQLPAGARSFALDGEHYNFFGTRCVKDLKLSEVTVSDSSDQVSVEFKVRPNEFKHDQGLAIRYADVTELTIGATGSQVQPVSNPNRFFLGLTTPREMHDLLRALVAGDLLSPESTDHLLSLLRSPIAFTDGIRREMSSAERARVATKAGWFADGRNEAGIMFDQAGAPVLTYAMFATHPDPAGQLRRDPSARAGPCQDGPPVPGRDRRALRTTGRGRRARRPPAVQRRLRPAHRPRLHGCRLHRYPGTRGAAMDMQEPGSRFGDRFSDEERLRSAPATSDREHTESFTDAEAAILRQLRFGQLPEPIPPSDWEAAVDTDIPFEPAEPRADLPHAG